MKCLQRIGVLSLLLPLCILAQSPSIKFNHITLEHGLSHSNVQAIVKDSIGFMWFATEDGLNKYDGNGVTVYRHDSQDSTSISSNNIQALVEGPQGRLWIGTLGGGLNVYDSRKDRFYAISFPDTANTNLGFTNIHALLFDSTGLLWIGYDTGGLICYDPNTESYVQFKTDYENFEKSICYDDIYSLCEAANGDIWIGTLGGGFDRYDKKTSTFHHYQHDESDSNSLSNNHVWCLFEDDDGILWIGTYGGGMDRFDPKSRQFLHYRHNTGDPYSLAHDVVFTIIDDGMNGLWVGTEEGGLCHFDRGTQRFINYKHRVDDQFSLAHNSVECLLIDEIGTVWVGTYNGGVNYFNIKQEKFIHFKSNSAPFSLSNSAILSFLEDSKGRIWIGTDGGGLNQFDRHSGRFTAYQHDPASPASLSHDAVLSLYEDKKGQIWVGTYAGGLDLFNAQTGSFKHFQHDPRQAHSISSNDVRALFEDSAGNFWVGTRFGLDRFNPLTGEFLHYTVDAANPMSLSHPAIYVIFQDNYNNVWFGTQGGLNRYDETEKGFISYLHDENNPLSISNNYINTIFQDSRGILWIGTGAGLNRYYYESNTFKALYENDGLPNDVVNGILEDSAGHLWVSTNKGIFKYNPVNKKFRYYDQADGLQSNEFHYNTCLHSSSGEMYFGGVNGFNLFHPDSLMHNTTVPAIVITDFLLMNEHVSVGDGEYSILTKNIVYTGSIIFNYKNSFFGFEFAALNYLHPHKNEYAYRMPPFQDDWIELGNQNSATFTGLNPGTYTFHVRGCNNDGVCNNEGRSVQVVITPPIWQRWWFKTIGVLVGTLLIGAVFILRTLSVQARNKELASINERLHLHIKERKKTEALIKKSLSEKEVLLKEIHHRVKNNLQVISSLLNLQSRSIKDKSLQGVFKESQNRIRTMALVHEKLYQSEDLSSIDFNGYIKSLVHNLTTVYQVRARRIEIDMQIEKIELSINMAIPLGLVINELISNVFKHAFPDTWEGRGLVTITMISSNGRICLTIKDNGVGIPQGFDIRKAQSLGLKLLVVIIEDQLDGSFEVLSENGTEYKIDCPIIDKS
ncbi:histidine kinase [bacterium]|nr:histidine kinase [bacterium]